MRPSALQSTSLLRALLATVALALMPALPEGADAASVKEHGGLSSPGAGIVAGPDGAMWFTEAAGSPRVGRMTTDGRLTGEFSMGISGSSYPAGIAAGADGALWFTEFAGNRIGRIATDGSVSELPPLTGGSAPAGITRGPDGALWFAELWGNRIGRVTADGTISEYGGLTEDSQPGLIAAGPDGALWFTEQRANRIGRMTIDGTLAGEFGTGISAGAQPWGIAAGPDGAMWFTEAAGDRIGRMTTDGRVTEFGPLAPGSKPLGITAGPDGAMWFTERDGDRIGRIAMDGTVTEYGGVTEDAAPTNITLGPDGSLWFTEERRPQIGRVTLDGDKPLPPPDEHPDPPAPRIYSSGAPKVKLSRGLATIRTGWSVLCGSTPETDRCTTRVTAAALAPRRSLGPAKRLTIRGPVLTRMSFRMSRAGTAFFRRRGKLRVRIALTAATVGGKRATRTLTARLAYPRGKP